MFHGHTQGLLLLGRIIREEKEKEREGQREIKVTSIPCYRRKRSANHR